VRKYRFLKVILPHLLPVKGMTSKVMAATDGPERPEGTGKRRLKPTQERSRARLATIMSSAEALIAAHGSDRMRMADVAESAGISIGSLYQYFPDKSAIIHALALRYNEASRACISGALKDASNVTGLRTAFAGLMDVFYALVRDNPVVRDIWAGMQADRMLTALQLNESRAMGALLAGAVRRVRPSAESGQLDATCFLLWELGEAAVRLAIASDAQTGEAMVAAYTRMAMTELVGAP
jgi:AcrR family transcriptional regulator